MKKLILPLLAFLIAASLSFLGVASGQTGIPVCGDGLCEMEYGESRYNCPQDCFTYTTPDVIMVSLIFLTAIVMGGILYRVRRKIIEQEKAAKRPEPMFPIASRVSTKVMEKGRNLKKRSIKKIKAVKSRPVKKKIKAKKKSPMKKAPSPPSTSKKSSRKKTAKKKSSKKIKIKKAVPRYYDDTLKKLKKLKTQLK
ncbi:MAG TPA: hypothetical protein ENN30_01265 [Candidatus Woesearchaeota archaeon]|nr:hypothetical protein [Candidatus Woesearchaeota archaeon]